MRSLDIVELKGVLLKNTADTTCLNPQESGKEEVKEATGDTNLDGLTIVCISSQSGVR